GRSRLAGIAPSKDDLCALLGEAARSLQADATRGPGHKNPLASDVPGHGGGSHNAVPAATPGSSGARAASAGRLPPSARAHGSPETILRYPSSVNADVVSVRALPW